MTPAADQPTVDLAPIEAAVQHALRTGDTSAIRLLGHGEVSIVIGWPSVAPEHAVKRIAPFRRASLASDYIDVCTRNLATMTDSGLSVWPTTFHTVTRDDGRVVVYHRQPIAESAQLGSNVLRAGDPTPTHPLIDAIVDAAAAVVTPRFGLDCQASNWVWDGRVAHQIDFSSPFMLNDERTDLLFDTATFLREYPVALRPYLRRELVKIVRRFTTPEGAIGDMIAMLFKEGLDDWAPTVVAAARDRHGIVVSAERSREMLAEDLKLFPLTLRLKKAQRRWMQITGRQYESLLPERTTYEHNNR